MIRKIWRLFSKKSERNNTIYNSDVYKSGLKNILCEYKDLLETDSIQENKNKIKNIDFHLTILCEKGGNQ